MGFLSWRSCVSRSRCQASSDAYYFDGILASCGSSAVDIISRSNRSSTSLCLCSGRSFVRSADDDDVSILTAARQDPSAVYHSNVKSRRRQMEKTFRWPLFARQTAAMFFPSSSSAARVRPAKHLTTTQSNLLIRVFVEKTVE